jgi:SAM-dependent methyltransferase
MDEVEGARTFAASGSAYDLFMGRYSIPLADVFADAADVRRGQTALDVGCGPGALTRVLVDRLGADAVAACDPSPPFVEECRARHRDVDVRLGRAEQIPFDDDRFDAALAQLVLHFVSDPAAAAAEMSRTVRPGGVVGACVWDFAKGMEMLRHFWDAASTLNPDAPDEARTLRFGAPGEIVELFEGAGLLSVEETSLTVNSSYDDFDEMWSGFLAGIGPAGVFTMSLPDDQRQRLRQDLYRRIGEPDGPFSLPATARCAIGRVGD